MVLIYIFGFYTASTVVLQQCTLYVHMCEYMYFYGTVKVLITTPKKLEGEVTFFLFFIHCTGIVQVPTTESISRTSASTRN